MIGNDIVDLVQAKLESNWRRKGFLDKLFTVHEQQLIHAASNPDQMVWLLWSMKESAYKLSVQSRGLRIFAPKKIACFVNELTETSVEGSVSYNGEYYKTQSIITSQYIASVALASNAIPDYIHLVMPFEDTVYQTHQRVIRAKIIQQCATLFSIPEQAIYIHKNSAGTPLLTVNNSLEIPLTISHHGHYGAFAIGSIY